MPENQTSACAPGEKQNQGGMFLACRCGEPIGPLHCRIDGEDVCVPCGQRRLLEHLRQQPFNLRPCNGWDDERLERLLAKAVKA